MPEIIPNQDFKHGAETYEEGEQYEVSSELAFYFQMCGWVGPRTVSTANITLDVHDGSHGHQAEVK